MHDTGYRKLQWDTGKTFDVHHHVLVYVFVHVHVDDLSVSCILHHLKIPNKSSCIISTSSA